jgi:hypothetical protein
MFAALLSPATYVQHSLHASLYAIVLSIAAAYAVTLWTLDRLDAYGQRLDDSTSRSQAIAVIVRERWHWLAPMWAAAVVLVVTMMTSQTRAANVFLYRSF